MFSASIRILRIMRMACVVGLFIAVNLQGALMAAPIAGGEPSSHPLVGKIAADFQLNDLEGNPVRLSGLRGKVVVLDFWRTQCPPCIVGLPVVTKVTAARKARGVVFYAINLNETADDVRAFQKRRNLAFPVLLDSDRKVADLYQVDGVPVSFLIDQSGRIEAVDFGYKPDREAKLSREIDTLLAGKSFLTAAPSLGGR
jgi:cytochrome c biogenesis protein CcmG/thiol:disulfide interchange protein DsbE